MNIEAFFQAPWHVQLHAGAAIAAVLLGAVQLIAPKGTLPHRQLGYVWVALMLTVAITAIFIRSGGSFSWIHIFVPLTLIGVASLILAARKGLVARHRGTVMGLYIGALMIPGAFSFLPGRLMHTVVTGG
ncbi:MAG TPA: hypothetical protein DF715_03880 [Oceanicaulis sp.]|uniref:DUF2306 domain-containing protein n=1 Tax=Glycocaulis albus TaxID=1382801 RepID=A0ABQ1XDS4_9PROT|nr:DUF2306 domain-containing protein [Glycocaulis albus]GGG89974.1 hypothetical protein GCM10007420_01240 [Glycocaulis albus]HCY54679.1 hypothetical protein [Oceanicaulis sp.]